MNGDEMSEPLELHVTYLAVPAAVSAARHALAETAKAAGASAAALDNIRLAVSEAVTNAVRHAYPDVPGDVEISARTVDASLFVLIEDEGQGLLAAQRSAGRCLGRR